MFIELFLSFVLALAPQSPAVPSSRASSPGATSLARVDRALFRIETDFGTGSGFQYRTPGYVLTNKHVVDQVPIGGTVKLRPVKVAADGSVGLGTQFTGKLRHKHPELDVAVIEVPSTVSTTVLSSVALKDGKHVSRGVEVYAHGFPGIRGAGGASPTLSRGMLSAHYPDPLTGQIFYLTDTALSPGSSGGPVTDSTGAVVGIATAVSIVVDGAGNSWGYILPIKSVEEALQCQKGLLGLPAAFDTARHVSAIKACTTPDAAIDKYRIGAEDAAKRCATATDLADAVRQMASAAASCPGVLQRNRFADWNDDSLRAGNALLTRAFEFQMLQRDEASRAALASMFKPGKFDEWVGLVVERSVDSLPEDQRSIALAELISTHAAGVSALIKTSVSDCGAMQQAAEALESPSATNRKNVRAFSKALASLVQTRVNLVLIDPERLDPDDASLPTPARQNIRSCKATLQNCVDDWVALPEDCRSYADKVLQELAEGAGVTEEAAPAAANAAKEADSIEASLEFWKVTGFSVWGDVQRGKTKESGHSYGLTFDQAPAIIWVGVLAPKAKDLSVTVTNSKDKKLDVAGGLVQGDIDWTAFEVRSDGRISVDFTAGKGENYDYEFIMVYRHSPLNAIRKEMSEKQPDMEEYAIKSFILSPGKSDEFTLDAAGMESFRLIAIDSGKNDIDLIAMDPKGKEVARDDEQDHFPAVSVDPVVKGKYTLRFVNQGKSVALVDSIIFVKRK